MRDSRITSAHLSRDAYLYVRQSTLRQVNENAESTRRQYALRERAPAAGGLLSAFISSIKILGCPAPIAWDGMASGNWLLP